MRDPSPPCPPARLPAPAAAIALLLSLPFAPLARAGDPAPAGPAAEATPRLTAVETEIRHLERHLQALRKVRTELTAGRAEADGSEGDARRARDQDVRALREIARYEAARAKALAAVAQAASGKDEARAAEARTALETADRQFLEAMGRVASAREPARDGGKADSSKPPAAKPADGRRRGKSSADTDGEPDDDEQ